jgi:predicted secreted protein
MNVVLGETFEVTLADLPGAGYRWVVTEIPDGVRLVDDHPVAPGSERLGSPRPRTFEFQADREGSYDLHFELVRPWEPRETTRPADERDITVDVGLRDTSGST